MTSKLSQARAGMRALAALFAVGFAGAATAQQPPTLPRLTLPQAIDAARRHQPDIIAAREALAAAVARERQAGAYPNPTLSYGREQTSAAGETSSQNIAAVEQRLEPGGLRAARADAARFRREAAAARLSAVVTQIEYETTRAYAMALAADRRSQLAEQATEAFAQARGVSERRLASGDVSGYAHRRIRLEAARYAGLRAEALLAKRAARFALMSLISGTADSIGSIDVVLEDSLPPADPGAPARVTGAPNASQPGEAVPDSLIRLALQSRSDLRALDRDAAVARAESRMAAGERVPTPALSVGYKTERIAGVGEQGNGFTAGVSIPLPVWDRRAGAVAAATAESRRRVAETDALRRRVVREVADAHDAYQSVMAQLAVLAPELGGETRVAMRAVQVAYSEGEATVIEWLDAVRAYQEAESSFAALRAEAMIRRAALDRALGVPLAPSTIHGGAGAPARD
jgi:cobalt-zinc-cadmium efflux system outer membrane protein